VSIGQGANVKLMQSIAEWGGGRAYYTDDPANIPKIFTGETTIIRKKTIVEQAMQPVQKKPGEILLGIDSVVLPVVYGQVVTYPKPQADLLIETAHGPLLAAWQYGLGRSVAFTSDLSNRWGKDWVKWGHYGRFTSQMVKWAQRRDTPQLFSAAVDRRAESGIFTVDVATVQNRFVNHLDLKANVLLPSGEDQTFTLRQIAPGRYAGQFPAGDIGAYFFSVYSDSKEYSASPRTFGFGIPHTEEFNHTQVNEKLLAALAAATNGRVLSINHAPPDLFADASDSKASETPVWHILLMLFLMLLIADIAVRKLFNIDGSLSFQ